MRNELCLCSCHGLGLGARQTGTDLIKLPMFNQSVFSEQILPQGALLGLSALPCWLWGLRSPLKPCPVPQQPGRGAQHPAGTGVLHQTSRRWAVSGSVSQGSLAPGSGGDPRGEGSVPQGQAPTGELRDLNALQPTWKNKQQGEPEPRARGSGSSPKHGSCSVSCKVHAHICTHMYTRTPEWVTRVRELPTALPIPTDSRGHSRHQGHTPTRALQRHMELLAFTASGKGFWLFLTYVPKHTDEKEINSRRTSG